MLDAANILIDRHPRASRRFVKRHIIRQAVSLPACKAREIPRAISKCIQGIRFAHRVLAAFWASDRVIFCARSESWVTIKRVAGFVKINVLGKLHRQISRRHWLRTASVAFYDGNRAAPITLTRHTPIAKAILGFTFTETHVFNFINGRRNAVIFAKPVKEP